MDFYIFQIKTPGPEWPGEMLFYTGSPVIAIASLFASKRMEYVRLG
jgi:hypothetical protein